MTGLALSPLAHTWLIDLDGTVCIHNGYKNGGDELLPGVSDFWSSIPSEDKIILLTARKSTDIAALQCFLNQVGLRYDQIIADLPMGERILLNDKKPSGLVTAIAVNLTRDQGLSDLTVTIDQRL
jgi:hypothetical protein